MLPFENMVADYIKETENRVLYRVTPVFKGDNLVASGVLMEAQSIEDNGAGISFNVFVYNAQPNISIDYATGNSRLETSTKPTEQTYQDTAKSSNSADYIGNKNTKKISLSVMQQCGLDERKQ